MIYKAAENRYQVMEYKRCGRSGVLLPRISLGLWQNFGLEKPLDEQKEILFRAFDLGITHLTWLTITDIRPMGWQRRISALSSNQTWAGTGMRCSFPPRRVMISCPDLMGTGAPGNI